MTASILMGILLSIADGFLLYHFFQHLLSNRPRFKKNYIVFFLLCFTFCLRFFLTRPAYVRESPVLRIAFTIGILPVMILTAVLFYKDSLFKKVLSSILFYLIVILAESATTLLTDLISDEPAAQALSIPSINWAHTIFSKFLVLLIVEFIIRKGEDGLTIPKYLRREYFLILTVTVAFFTYIIIMYSNDEWLTQNADFYISICFFALLFDSFLFVLITERLSRRSKEELDYSLRLQQIEAEDRLNKDISNVMETLRRLRHDMNNHIGIIKGLSDTGQYEDLKSYIHDLYEDADFANHFILLENTAMSVLINSKINKAQQLQVDYQNIITLQSLELKDKDMCALLGNILDNALEAASKCPEGERYVELDLYKTDAHYHIDCKNTYAVLPVIQNGRFITTKQNKKIHGIGTETIKAIAAQYNGTAAFTVKDMFCVEVRLPLSK